MVDLVKRNGHRVDLETSIDELIHRLQLASDESHKRGDLTLGAHITQALAHAKKHRETLLDDQQQKRVRGLTRSIISFLIHELGDVLLSDN